MCTAMLPGTQGSYAVLPRLINQRSVIHKAPQRASDPQTPPDTPAPLHGTCRLPKGTGVPPLPCLELLPGGPAEGTDMACSPQHPAASGTDPETYRAW